MAGENNKKNKYKRNFLTKVILRLNFEQAQLGQLKKVLEKEEFKKCFPISSEEKGEEGVIDINFITKEVNQTSGLITSWIFHNEKKTKKIKIHPKFLFIEYNEYSDSKELLDDVKIISGLLDDFNIKTINRLDLRYINEIKLADDNFINWDDYIEKHLLGSLKFSLNNKKKISRAMSTIVFKENNNNITFQYGIWNANYPNEINEKIFILDFDAASKYPIDVAETNLSGLIKEYNQNIESLFESSIKDGLRKILKE